MQVVRQGYQTSVQKKVELKIKSGFNKINYIKEHIFKEDYVAFESDDTKKIHYLIVSAIIEARDNIIKWKGHNDYVNRLKHAIITLQLSRDFSYLATKLSYAQDIIEMAEIELSICLNFGYEFKVNGKDVPIVEYESVEVK